MNQFAHLSKVGLRFILRSGAVIVREFTETEARKFVEDWMVTKKRNSEGNPSNSTMTIGSVDQSNVVSVWAMDVDAVEFMDVVKIDPANDSAVPQQQIVPNTQSVRGW